MTPGRSPARPVRRGRGRLGSVGRVASGAAVVLVLVVGGAAPVGATPQRTLSLDPEGDLSSPPTVSGSFKGSTLLLDVEKIVAVTLTASPSGPTGGSAVTRDGCEVATAGVCDSSQVSFSWAISDLAYNGPYVVDATAQWCDPLLCLSPAAVSADPVEFRLAAEPAAPTDLRVDTRADRSVVVSWARNGEPDLQHYGLFRKDPGGEFRRVGGDIAQPESGRPTFTDTSVAGTNGGDFVYRVFAVRNGLSGDDTTEKISKASGDRTATVVPPATTSVPGSGTDPNAPPVTVAGEGVDISSFLSGQAPALDAPSPIFLDLPDTGFGETLPFGFLPGDEAEPGEEDAVLPDSPRAREIAQFNRNRPLIPVAAGAILLVLAGHIRLLNVRTRQPAASKKLPPGAYVARALAEARAGQIPIDVATAVANGGHHRAPPGDDVARLPVWAEFEPVSALGLPDEAATSDPSDPSADGLPDDVLPEAAQVRRQFELFAPRPFDFEAERPAAATLESEDAEDEADLEAAGAVAELTEDEARFAAEMAEAEARFEAEVAEDEDEFEAAAEFESDDEPKFEPEAEQEDEPEDEMEFDADFEAAAASNAAAELEDEDEPEFDPDFEAAAAFEAAAELEAEDEPDFEPAAESEPAAEFELDSEPEPEPLPTPAPMPVQVLVRQGRRRPERRSKPRSEPPAETDEDPEPALDLEALYAFDTEARWLPEPEPEPESHAEPDPELLYAFDDESEWSAEPEVFVSPRR